MSSRRAPESVSDFVLAVNLLTGACRYRLRLFLAFVIVGRLIWSSAYLSLGYVFGVAIEAAADFTSSLSGLLVSLLILAALGFIIQRITRGSRPRRVTNTEPR